MWNEIASEKDLNSFIDTVYGFHDSCLKKLKYIMCIKSSVESSR